MLPEIHLGPLTLQTFGICFAAAFIAAGAVVWRRLGELGKPVDWAYEMGFAALVGGLVGSRLDFIIENYSDVKGDLLGNLFSGSGLVWYGGAIGGAIGVFIWAWWRGFFNLTLLDVAAPAVGVGYAIGRCGCQLSGDGDYGKAWNGPWAMAYPDGTKPTDQTVTPPVIFFRINRDGSIADVRIERSSGLPFVDRAAQRAVLASSPLPPLPADFHEGSLGVHLKFE